MTQFVCNTSKGEVEITLVREWSPLGVERFEQLVDDGFFTNIPLSRCIEGFLCQFGYKPSSSQLRAQEYGTILDDVPNPATPREFKRGYLSFAGNGANSRSQHLFVTLGQQVKSLGTMPWETPIGYVSSHSMQSVVSKFETKYGDQGPDPNRVIAAKGNEYLSRHFPDLDYLHSCRRKLVVISVELGPNLGAVEIELHPEWAPLGVNRLLDMIRARFLDEARVFRVVPGFVVQFGMPADPKRGGEFPQIKDDPVKQSNKRGTITFAMAGPNTRTFQLFINLGDNARLDAMKFAPIGRVIKGMEFVDRINAEYGEFPDQGEIARRGNSYLKENFPNLSYLSSVAIVPTENGADVSMVPRQLPPPPPPQQQSSFEFAFPLVILLLVVLGFALVIKKLFATSSSSPAKARHLG